MSTQTVKVELNTKTANPFYGLRNCLALYQKPESVNKNVLDNAWKEVSEDKERREMFFSLLFSIGDITARQHNIFSKNKTDNGGSAERTAFMVILTWLKENNYTQYKRFLFSHLIAEYTTFDNLYATRIQTKRKTGVIVSIINMIGNNEEWMNDLADYTASIIQGNNPVNKYFVAKFLTRPRLSKRAGHKSIQPTTVAVMKVRQALIQKVSDRCGFHYETKGTHIEFRGYYEWRKQYIGDMESVLFSSQKIKDFDKNEFLEWLEKLPASARHRVRCRLLDRNNQVKTTKWGELPQWFLHWEAFKSQKQAEQRQLEEKARQGLASEDDKAKLIEVKKDAKVTTGAVNFKELFTQIVLGSVDKVKVQPFLDKIKLDYNTLVIMDDSGSMKGSYYSTPFSAYEFATFMATICLTKNPDDEARDLVGLFSNTCRLFNRITGLETGHNNSIWNKQVRAVNEPLIKPEAHFLENLDRMRSFVRANMTGNGTDISSIPRGIANSIAGNAEMLEALMRYPVWTIITDGNWNNLSSPEASLNDMLRTCEGMLGFKPYIVAIDVGGGGSASAERFSGIDNFMYVQPNPVQIEQFLTNFKDMDIMDVYTPLQGLHRSNRYAPVRKVVV